MTFCSNSYIHERLIIFKPQEGLDSNGAILHFQSFKVVNTKTLSQKSWFPDSLWDTLWKTKNISRALSMSACCSHSCKNYKCCLITSHLRVTRKIKQKHQTTFDLTNKCAFPDVINTINELTFFCLLSARCLKSVTRLLCRSVERRVESSRRMFLFYLFIFFKRVPRLVLIEQVVVTFALGPAWLIREPAR